MEQELKSNVFRRCYYNSILKINSRLSLYCTLYSYPKKYFIAQLMTKIFKTSIFLSIMSCKWSFDIKNILITSYYIAQNSLNNLSIITLWFNVCKFKHWSLKNKPQMILHKLKVNYLQEVWLALKKMIFIYHHIIKYRHAKHIKWRFKEWALFKISCPLVIISYNPYFYEIF